MARACGGSSSFFASRRSPSRQPPRARRRTRQRRRSQLYDNCTNFNKKYPHGVGKVGARDKTKSKTADPVTNFKRSNTLYRQAMNFNQDLDRDDGIACEKD